MDLPNSQNREQNYSQNKRSTFLKLFFGILIVDFGREFQNFGQEKSGISGFKSSSHPA